MVAAVDERLDTVGHPVYRRVLHTLLDSFRHGPDGRNQAVALGHRHLPKLEALGFVVVGAVRDLVTACANLSPVTLPIIVVVCGVGPVECAYIPLET
ncbi:hypothetical protein Halar_0574 (plasmid) [halophilic archaeon DL31]|jgi:hypothetical protein|nr:hypothetical protein Halar_0574 [halophilic archaeon DL31]